MPRPRKCRKVCCLPKASSFSPDRPDAAGLPAVVMTVDEYETIRLIDHQGLSQEECSVYLQVARTTAQLIYNSARQKLARALVLGLPLRIEGGSYQLCDGKEPYCACGGCSRHRKAAAQQDDKEAKIMRIAIPVLENQTEVSPSFGRAPYFLLFDPQSGQQQLVQNPAANAENGAGPQAAQLLIDWQVTTLITPRCGQNAADLLTEAELEILRAQGANAQENLQLYQQHKLAALTSFHAGFHGIR